MCQQCFDTRHHAHQGRRSGPKPNFTVATGSLDRTGANGIAWVKMEAHEKISVSPLPDGPALGGFVLIGPLSGDTSATGVLNHTLR